MKKRDALKTKEFYQSLGKDDDETVGRTFGLPKYVVAQERRKMGIPCVHKKWAKPRDEWLQKYLELGSCRKVAELYGVSRQWAHHVIKREEERRK